MNGATLPTTGAGIKVGVMSTSFNNLSGAATDEMDGALPPAANIQVLKDLASGGDDEGRAMMQIVHDIAAAANLAFYTADISEQDFADGIIKLADAGCNIICDDFTYDDEPFFQTGVVANAIQQVEQRGVIFVTCAGNRPPGATSQAPRMAGKPSPIRWTSVRPPTRSRCRRSGSRTMYSRARCRSSWSGTSPMAA